MSQLDQYKALVHLDFTEESHTLKLMIEKTLELIDLYSPKFLEANKNFQMECNECNKQFRHGESQLLEIEGSGLNCDDLSLMFENEALKSCQEHTKVCKGNISVSTKQDFVFVHFQTPMALHIPMRFKLLGDNFKYRSHVCEVQPNTSFKYSTHFVHENYQFVHNNGIIGLSEKCQVSLNQSRWKR